MTPEQIQIIIEKAISQANSFPWWSYILFIALSGLASYFAVYLREKGKNLATKEDISEITKKIENIKLENAKELSDHNLWHDKRIASLLAIHDALQKCTKWLRRELYCSPPQNMDITPLHDFFDSIQEQLVYLNDDLRRTILKYEEDILKFWNWTVTLRTEDNQNIWEEVQKRLYFEIPKYLENLRQDINKYAETNNSEEKS